MSYSRTLSIILVSITALILTSCTSQQGPRVPSNPAHMEQVLENTGSIITGTTPTGSTVTMEVINGISVPPEPDTVVNNATLAGIDVNNNGVRDDIERRVAEKSLKESGYNAKMKIAIITQKLLVSPRVTQQEMDMIQHDLNCAAIASIESRGSTSNISIEALVLNTSVRLTTYRNKTMGYSGGIMYINDDSCK